MFFFRLGVVKHDYTKRSHKEPSIVKKNTYFLTIRCEQKLEKYRKYRSFSICSILSTFKLPVSSRESFGTIKNLIKMKIQRYSLTLENSNASFRIYQWLLWKELFYFVQDTRADKSVEIKVDRGPGNNISCFFIFIRRFCPIRKR